MSVQTTVLENGRWITRYVDPYHVRAQNTEMPRKEPSQPSINLPKPPSLGILTKTLVRSSVINRIIPARIRHKAKNDVLFISANSVAIKEAQGDYTLREIVTMTDFDSTIKSARIIGERRKLTNYDESYNTLKEDHWLNDVHSDDIYTNEDDAMDRQELPPHILVLALESNRLVFVCVISGKSEVPELLSSQKALPALPSPLQGLGELIAVDPDSRAMAVAACEGRFYVYALKSMDEMRAEFRNKSRLEPIKQEKLVLIDGSILKMEFLHPPDSEPNRIILLLVVARNPRNRLVWYDWNADMPLHQAQMRPSKAPLHPDEELPLLLIPLMKNAAFILVCEKRIVLIKDILTGGFHRFFHHLAFEQEPEEPGASQRRPIWVQWARPMRSKRMWPSVDNIVLCREDGIVQYMVINHDLKQMIDSNHNVGRLGVNINTSFATIDLGRHTEDLLIAGGDESDGGLWGFPPRQKYPNQRGILPNWTSINDFAVANVPIEPQAARAAAAANNGSKKQQRLFACSGRGKHGAISELRYGVEGSKKIRTVDIGDDLKNGVLGIWALHGFHGHEEESQTKYLGDVTYIILSHPLRTYLLRLELIQDPEPAGTDDKGIEKDVGLLESTFEVIGDDVNPLDVYARTIAVGRTTRGLTIQITETSLRAMRLPRLPKDEEIKEEDAEDRKPDKIQLDAERSQPPYVHTFANSHILAACIHPAVGKTIIVLAGQRDGHFYVEIGTFSSEYQPLEHQIPLHAQPSCLSLLQVEKEPLILLGTVAGELEIYNIGSELLNPTKIAHYAFAGPFGICGSIATIVKATTNEMQPLLICGLRDGTVEVLNLSKGSGSCHLRFCEKIAFGLTSVTVLKDTTIERAIVHCENSVCTIEYPQTNSNAPATVLNVWTTDPNKPSLQQGNIIALNQVRDSWLPGLNPGFTAASFVCIDGGQLHMISLDAQPKMVPRRLDLGGTPVRVIYSTHLDKLIVLHNKYQVLRTARQVDGQHHVGGKRGLRPMISFLDPRVDPDTVVNPDAMDMDDAEGLISECGRDEKVLGMTEWFPKDCSGTHHILVLNTSVTRPRKSIGRLLLFTIISEENKTLRIEMKKIITTDEPVYSVATYSDTSFVYCCENDLYMQTLGVTDPSRITLQSPVKIAMRSPGRHITVKEPYVYVSSSRESLSVYRYDAGQLVYQFGDQYARSGWHHLHLPTQSLILASNRACTVVGLWQPPERRIDNAMTTLFEAVLPGSITRLRRIFRPIWSRRDHELHGSNVDNSNDPSSLEPDTILGSSADGTLTQMSILLSNEWRLLRFLQNMAERNPLICPFHAGNPHRRQIEPSTSRPHYMHINGDILERVLGRGGETLLDEMLDVEPDDESHTDFGSKEDRRSRFEELAMDVLKDVDGGDVVGRVVLWLRYQLRNAL